MIISHTVLFILSLDPGEMRSYDTSQPSSFNQEAF